MAGSGKSSLCEIDCRTARRTGDPPAAPQIRPIELFWSHLKSRVYEGGWEAKTKDELEKRILEQFDSFDESYFVNLMKKVKRKVRKAADHGLISLTK